MKHALVVIALSMSAVSAALADEVVLRSGHKVTGIQREEKDRIIVETGYGTVAFPRDQVVSVTKGDTPLHAYPVRLAEIDKSTNPKDFIQLAAWAKENRMPRYVPELMNRVLKIDPDNAEARAELGFVRRKGAWVTSAEARQDPKADDGRWVNPLEKELQEKRRLDSMERQLRRAADQLEREERRRTQRAEADLQARIRAAEAPPADTRRYWDNRHWDYRHYGWDGYWGWRSDVYDLILVDWIIGFRAGAALHSMNPGPTPNRFSKMTLPTVP